MPFLIALKSLTTLPVHPAPPTPADRGASLDWYGAVGLLIGLILALAGWLMSAFLAPMVAAALVLALWVPLSGALHLGDLGGCVDACREPSRERAFEVMEKSRSSTLATTAVGVLLILKFAALSAIAARGDWLLVAAAPLLARAGVQVLYLTCTHAREDEPGAAVAAHHDRARVTAAAVIAVLASVALVGSASWWLLPLLAIVFLLLRRLMMRRLLGVTDRGVGASVEILEAAAIAAAA